MSYHSSDSLEKSSYSMQEDVSFRSFSNMSQTSFDNEVVPLRDKMDMSVFKASEKAVFWARALLGAVLLVAVTAMTSATYVVLDRASDDNFENQFRNHAYELVTVMNVKIENTIDTLEAFSNTVSSLASLGEMAWPNVTIPDFESQASRLLQLTKAHLTSFAPIVSYNQVNHWEEFYRQNINETLQDSIDYLGDDSIHLEHIQTHPEGVQNYYGPSKKITESFPYGFPVVWQVSPISSFFIQYTNVPAFADRNVADTFFIANALQKTAINFFVFENGQAESQIMQPIFRNVKSGRNDRDTKGDHNSETMVGVIWLVLDWKQYFEGFLPPDANGIVIVLESQCNPYQKISYRINRDKVEVLGSKDLHDPKYDDMKISSNFVHFDVDPETLSMNNPVYSDDDEDSEYTPPQNGSRSENDYGDDDDEDNSGPWAENNGNRNNYRDELCIPSLTMSVYPSDEYKASFNSNEDILYSLAVVGIFLVTSIVFMIYDYKVRKRQNKIMGRVLRQHQIVSDVFPAKFRDQLYEIASEASMDDYGRSIESPSNASDYNNTKQDGVTKRRGSLVQSRRTAAKKKTLAELYPSVTVVYMDISGFTAWSSTREPFQVFEFLEAIYIAFDDISYRHDVFKVETVGDCYVAAAGLPEPREDHVIAVASFARECVHKMSSLTKELEMTLGPDTGDLAVRVGIHSGQVTAGILRGERSRFQLFGETVNTASQMEATGSPNRIQVSDRSADLLRRYGKSRWIHPRKEPIAVKGKGEMQTYWLETKAEKGTRRKKNGNSGSIELSYNKPTQGLAEMAPLMEEEDCSEGFPIGDTEWESDGSDLDLLAGHVLEEAEEEAEDDEVISKTKRLVEWNVDILSSLLRQIVAARGHESLSPSDQNLTDGLILAENQLGKGETVLEEFKPIITLPKIGMEELKRRADPESIDLGETVVSQLRDLITEIASMYRHNNFHNFEHASHVTSSVRKLLSRIVSHGGKNEKSGSHRSSANSDDGSNGDKADDVGSPGVVELVDLSNHSYGITSDPLTQFSVVFSAVIHDADHPGVTNMQLVKEKVPIAAKYREKSVAEQTNSVSLVWELLMEQRFRELRSCIYRNEDELRRFRQLVVNTVMATDIVDKELGALRKKRWNKAFAPELTSMDNIVITPEDDMDRKATIVIEHLIQASDVSHTMQHWAVYKKWNERYFMECYGAYRAGRAESDPSVNWYKGEIGFFDYYVIPLAKKLESCGVFGVSSHEYLNYAVSNREEWVRVGEGIVRSYLENFSDLESKKTADTTESWHDDTEITL